MKYLLLTISCFIGFVSCQQESRIRQEIPDQSEQQTIDKTPTTEEITAQYIPKKNDLEFDKIIHYRNDKLSSNDILLGDESTTTTKAEKLLDEFGFKIKVEMKDTSKIQYLEEIGYKKYPIDTKYLATIKALIHPNVAEYFVEETTCERIYRDILVFKNEGKTVAIVKWCFDCGDIIWAKIDGKSMDLEVYSGKLATILYENWKTQ